MQKTAATDSFEFAPAASEGRGNNTFGFEDLPPVIFSVADDRDPQPTDPIIIADLPEPDPQPVEYRGTEGDDFLF
ncbi:MAG: hypothetical protein AAF401_16115 [Pseudomonadota bacterium]